MKFRELMKAWIGKTLMGIAVGHSIIGLILFRSALNVIFNDGVFNTIALSENPNRESAFWFLYSGFLLLLIGSFVDYLERLALDIPLLFVIALSILTAIGIVVMPISGFWLLTLPVLGLIIRTLRFKSE